MWWHDFKNSSFRNWLHATFALQFLGQWSAGGTISWSRNAQITFYTCEIVKWVCCVQFYKLWQFRNPAVNIARMRLPHLIPCHTHPYICSCVPCRGDLCLIHLPCGYLPAILQLARRVPPRWREIGYLPSIIAAPTLKVAVACVNKASSSILWDPANCMAFSIDSKRPSSTSSNSAMTRHDAMTPFRTSSCLSWITALSVTLEPWMTWNWNPLSVFICIYLVLETDWLGCQMLVTDWARLETLLGRRPKRRDTVGTQTRVYDANCFPDKNRLAYKGWLAVKKRDMLRWKRRIVPTTQWRKPWQRLTIINII